MSTDAPMVPPSRPGSDAGGMLVLDREFWAATLSALREAVLSAAAAAGLSRDRSIDVMLAAHEVAANVIRHGSGRGRLCIRVTSRTMSCQVSETGTAGIPGLAGQRQADTPPVARAPASWPVEHGHGLWLVRKTADQVQVTAGPSGSVVSMTFNLPAATLPTA